MAPPHTIAARPQARKSSNSKMRPSNDITSDSSKPQSPLIPPYQRNRSFGGFPSTHRLSSTVNFKRRSSGRGAKGFAGRIAHITKPDVCEKRFHAESGESKDRRLSSRNEGGFERRGLEAIEEEEMDVASGEDGATDFVGTDNGAKEKRNKWGEQTEWELFLLTGKMKRLEMKPTNPNVLPVQKNQQMTGIGVPFSHIVM